MAKYYNEKKTTARYIIVKFPKVQDKKKIKRKKT